MERNIVCLKWGDKYSSQYVNVLYNMCKRHNSLPFKFFCMTENTNGLNGSIQTIPLPAMPIQGWWYKTYVFSKDLQLTGNVLFLDLDLIVHSSMDKLWDFRSNSFVIIRDFTRHLNPNWKKFNSSVFKFNPLSYYWIWEDFKNNHHRIISKNYGDQDYLYNVLSDQGVFWPDEWIRSYKWEMRNKNELALINGKRNFTSIKNPFVHSESCISVFHGDPNPHLVSDPWVIENWK